MYSQDLLTWTVVCDLGICNIDVKMEKSEIKTNGKFLDQLSLFGTTIMGLFENLVENEDILKANIDRSVKQLIKDTKKSFNQNIVLTRINVSLKNQEGLFVYGRNIFIHETEPSASIDQNKSYVIDKLSKCQFTDVYGFFITMDDETVQNIVKGITNESQSANSKDACFNSLLIWWMNQKHKS